MAKEIQAVTTDMKMGYLKGVAKDVNVTYKVGMTKEQLVGAINEAIVAQDPNVEVIDMENENKLVDPAETVETPAEEAQAPETENLTEVTKLGESEIKPATDENGEELADAAPEADEEDNKEKGPSKREQLAEQIEGLKQDPEIIDILEKAESKADKIRGLLAHGLERKVVAKVLNIRYQMVYQVEQRMLAQKKTEELRAQAIDMKDAIKEIGMEQARQHEEYSEELLAEVQKLIDKEAKEAAVQQAQAEEAAKQEGTEGAE